MDENVMDSWKKKQNWVQGDHIWGYDKRGEMLKPESNKPVGMKRIHTCEKLRTQSLTGYGGRVMEKNISRMLLSFLFYLNGWDVKAIPWAGKFRMRNRFKGRMMSLILNMKILKCLWNVQEEWSSRQSGIYSAAARRVGLQTDLEVIKQRGSAFK